MKFLLLAMLLSVVQASPPIPRQTPDSSTTASNSSQENSNPKNRPADQRPPAINEQTQPQKHSEPSKQQAQTDTQHSITVSELPPVTINNHRDDVFGNHWYTNYRFIFGAPEKGRFYRSEKGTLCGAMGADSEGNDAD
jgi:hypothetical protein